MKECSTVSFKGQVIYCGIDVHKNSWHVSIRHCGQQIANFSMNPEALELVRHLRRNYPDAEYRSVYEAGFSGFEAHRMLCNTLFRMRFAKYEIFASVWLSEVNRRAQGRANEVKMQYL